MWRSSSSAVSECLLVRISRYVLNKRNPFFLKRKITTLQRKKNRGFSFLSNKCRGGFICLLLFVSHFDSGFPGFPFFFRPYHEMETRKFGDAGRRRKTKEKPELKINKRRPTGCEYMKRGINAYWHPHAARHLPSIHTHTLISRRPPPPA